jgi:hypothetical protein
MHRRAEEVQRMRDDLDSAGRTIQRMRGARAVSSTRIVVPPPAPLTTPKDSKSGSKKQAVAAGAAAGTGESAAAIPALSVVAGVCSPVKRVLLDTASIWFFTCSLPWPQGLRQSQQRPYN